MIERLEKDLKDLKPKHGYVEIRPDLAVKLPELLRSLAELAAKDATLERAAGAMANAYYIMQQSPLLPDVAKILQKALVEIAPHLQ